MPPRLAGDDLPDPLPSLRQIAHEQDAALGVTPVEASSGVTRHAELALTTRTHSARWRGFHMTSPFSVAVCKMSAEISTAVPVPLFFHQ